MRIGIDSPELQILIERLIVEGKFATTQDALLYALRVALTPSSPGQVNGEKQRQGLEQVFAKVRGLADDVDFSRDRAPRRAVDLS